MYPIDFLLQVTASDESSPSDKELFDERFEDSKRYLALCDCSVRSTDVPDRFLTYWQVPVGSNDAEFRQIAAAFHSDEEGVLCQLPLYVFVFAHHDRYEKLVPPTFDSDPDDEAILARITADKAFRAEAEAFHRRFWQFQTLVRYIFTLRKIGAKEQLRSFDLFDIAGYDAVIGTIDRDLTDGTIPRFTSRIC